ncbi:MAG: methionine--tRNA ligase [Bacteriovoracaceae bacterium]|nr:methionine--tRNA ligase [Bacteriovoracaceae bacterium]
MTKKFLVTSALPYANGPLHFGHIAGVYLPADIYVRHKKLQGNNAIHISGSDEHGVAIMLNAQKAKIPYKQYVDEWHKKHKELFDRYEIKFDFFGQTSADYHAEEVLKWFDVLYKKGAIEKEDELQLQCQSCSNYLPDRYVEGECYVCKYPKARGDECPNCGTWIDPLKLINPECKFCQSHDIKPVNNYQWYLKLSKYHKEFTKWFATNTDWRKTVTTFVESLSKESLHDRAITRDLDWGIPVPLAEAKGKRLYVWFDAPIGYVSNTKKYLETIGSKDDYLKDWWNNKDVEISHFIGKDNIIFHAIIFPVMAMGTGFIKPPTHLPANQYLNLMGKQFSKSQGWYVDSEEAITEFGSDSLRYYLTTLIPESSDSSFTWTNFEARINNELANNIGNFINRSMAFFYKNWQEGLEADYFQAFFKTERAKKIEETVKAFNQELDGFNIKRGLEMIMALGNEANLYFSDAAPWAQYKVDQKAAAETIAFSAVYTAVLGVMFEPYLPKLSAKIIEYFGEDLKLQKAKIYQGDFKALAKVFSKPIKLPFKPEGLVPKIDPKRIEELKKAFQE